MLGTWQDGEVFTCGRGIEGQLGVEDITFCLFPQRVHALARQVRRGGRVLCCGGAAKVFAPRRWCFWSQLGGSVTCQSRGRESKCGKPRVDASTRSSSTRGTRHVSCCVLRLASGFFVTIQPSLVRSCAGLRRWRRQLLLRRFLVERKSGCLLSSELLHPSSRG